MYSSTFHPGSDTDEDGEATHVLSVALRQRQIPSRLRKFLCLKPGSSLSQMYWTKEKEREREREVRERECQYERAEEGFCQAAHRGVEQITEYRGGYNLWRCECCVEPV